MKKKCIIIVDSGFALIEMIVVITITATLAAFITPFLVLDKRV
ncbi:MAG: type II secretion system protein [Planctomycetota bacterium]